MSNLTNTSTVSGVLDNIAAYKYNPAGIQRVILQHLQDVTAGTVDIIDPTNPFVFALESASVSTAAFMTENEVNTRRLYPALAQTPEDLYIHMSDKDFVDRFASPATTTFNIMIAKDDLLSKLIYDPETLGTKITIPRNSEFTIADVTFSLQYPIVIRQLVHGGLQVVYDTDTESPLQSLPSNVIEYSIRTDTNQIDWLYFEFEVQQFKVVSNSAALSTATGFNQTVTLTDNFYYARVFYKPTLTSGWIEMRTTHTDQVYDALKPTAVLKVVDKDVTVSIPQVYFNTNLVVGTIRVDLYETRGALQMAMTNYKLSAFSTKWRNLDTAESTAYTAAITNITAIAYSTKIVDGGSAALTYDQLRLRVMNNATGPRDTPITNVQIESSLEKEGYTVVKNVDLVTNRVFLATKPLPSPANTKLITAAASSIETLIVSMNDLVTHAGVKNNGLRVTITPDLVYTNDSGIINIVPAVTLANVLNLKPDDIATKVTNSSYLYTPFHYVLDASGSEFQIRPYFLDRPVAETVHFISQNDLTQLQVNTSTYALTRTTTGYKLRVVTKSNTTAQDLSDDSIKAQLSFVPAKEDNRAYLQGTYIGRTASNERIFDFDLSSNFDVDSSHNLGFTKFFMFTTEDRVTFSPLLQDFDILYSTVSTMPSTWITSGVDDLLGKFLLPLVVYGITHETLKLRFGYSLSTLWARSRSVAGSAPYEKYTSNVPWIYDADVYQKDPVTGFSFVIDGGGNVTYNILHHKGDPVLGSDGNPLFRYQIGDVKLDELGLPIVIDSAVVKRQLDMMFIEGAYFFATDTSAATYRDDMVDTVVNWLTEDLVSMGDSLLEQTRLYFYPKTTMGNIKVVADGGTAITIEAGQYFVVDLYVSDAVYNNTKLRDSLKSSTISTIAALLQNATVSMSTLVSQLKTQYGDDVISLNASGLGGDRNLTTVTVINDGDRCNIRKSLVKQSDNKLIVAEDVTCNFIKHGA